ncbi:MAG: anti-anti-sigma factor [Geobacteraceae bacterium GWC2_55_20]|nr:MAG: anti-anti-sigma factor [Geobacteraceae bacterium GWC2_55_20]OGU23099.1 MAG: anti-anti-sigma factor [Geobacteraceae bacterium GWF2_54_21]HCE66044.1 anti-anti-sigma factor [Geobacter sp.]
MAFDAQLAMTDSIAKITLTGSLDASSAPRFKEVIEQAAVQSPSRLVLLMKDLEFLASAGLRVLIFAKQKMGAKVDIYVVGSQGPVLGTLEMSGFHHSVYIQDTYADA